MRAASAVGFALLVAMLCAPASAQIVFDWDGDTSDDWFGTTNWEVFGGDPDPGLGDPPVPDTTIRVEIFEDGSGSAPAPVIRNQDAFAGEVRIGRSAGAGALTIESGSLSTAAGDSGIKFRVGNGGPAAFTMLGGELNLLDGTMVTGNGSNSSAQVNVDGGVINIVGSSRDLNMDENNPSAGSNLTMTAGEINIGDVFLVDGTASVDLMGGTISSVDDVRIRSDGAINVSGGSLLTLDEIDLGDGSDPGGTLSVTGGLVRGDRFSFGPGGSISLDDTGLLQVVNAQESVTDVEALITGGTITSSSDLSVSVVSVDGVDYTQVAVVAGGVPGDFNGDGRVDNGDLNLLLGSWGASTVPGDWVNGFVAPVDNGELNALLGGWGFGVPAATPEPTGVLLLMAGVVLLRKLERR